MNYIQPLIIYFLPFVGAFISFYILYHKKTNKKMVCLVAEECDEVVNSKYGSMFGIPNEALGILYYAFLVGASAFQIYWPTIIGISVSSFMQFATVMAAIMSVVLTLIQIFVLRKLCEYCLLTALINIILIFIVF